MTGKPRVLNKRIDTIPKGAVYVGRPSKWGNPAVLGKDTKIREEAIEMYRRWLKVKLAVKELDISELTGKDLVCWCAPLPCHAGVLLEMANE